MGISFSCFSNSSCIIIDCNCKKIDWNENSTFVELSMANQGFKPEWMGQHLFFFDKKYGQEYISSEGNVTLDVKKSVKAKS